MLPSFCHVSAIQQEGGLAIWDGHKQELLHSNLFFAAGTINTVALTDLTGAVGHQGAHGCHIQCSLGGHHKPGVGTYYSMAALSYDCEENPSHC